MIEVGGGQLEAKRRRRPGERVQQGGGVGATRYRDQHRPAASDNGVGAADLEDDLDQVDARHGGFSLRLGSLG
jgi:hypothetical protein